MKRFILLYQWSRKIHISITRSIGHQCCIKAGVENFDGFTVHIFDLFGRDSKLGAVNISKTNSCMVAFGVEALLGGATAACEA